ncbi:hypothetical protein Mapa_003556 [Marchantia paleacea]|nr:hypothetical protein Mapa_003556 [Marchantia paleacea]
MEVDPDQLTFTQDSIAVHFKKPREKERIDDAVISILQGTLRVSDFPRLRVVCHEGRLWSLDNRRLWVYKKAKVRNIPVDLVPYNRLHRFAELMQNPELKMKLARNGFWPRVRGQCRKVFHKQTAVHVPPATTYPIEVRQPIHGEITAELPVISRPYAHDGQNQNKWPVTRKPDERVQKSGEKNSSSLVSIFAGLVITILVLSWAESRRPIVKLLSIVIEVTFCNIIPTVGSWAFGKVWGMTLGGLRLLRG